jgi:hypothetical protein
MAIVVSSVLKDATSGLYVPERGPYELTFRQGRALDVPDDVAAFLRTIPGYDIEEPAAPSPLPAPSSPAALSVVPSNKPAVKPAVKPRRAPAAKPRTAPARPLPRVAAKG